MTVLLDGQAKCDKCGALDGNIALTLTPGWTSVPAPISDSNPFGRTNLHYCPKCSKGAGP